MDFDSIAPFLRSSGVRWADMLRAFGAEKAHQNALRWNGWSRDIIMADLRLRDGWTLQAIGDLFGVTREYVRQVIGNTGRCAEITAPQIKSERRRDEMKRETERLLRKAIYEPTAWAGSGLNGEWVAANSKVADIHLSRRIGKLGAIFRYGLGLKTAREVREWLAEQYYTKLKNYDEVAAALSQKFIPVSTMGLYRFCLEVGFRGEDKGRYSFKLLDEELTTRTGELRRRKDDGEHDGVITRDGIRSIETQ